MWDRLESTQSPLVFHPITLKRALTTLHCLTIFYKGRELLKYVRSSIKAPI
jgi:hypothetical protein